MKKILKILGIIFGVLLLLFIVLGLSQYKKDIPEAIIKTKYELLNSQYLDMQGMQVHYVIEGEGEPLVLLHGTGSSLHTWEKWSALLKDSFKVIRVDLPGFGLTGPNPADKYTNEAYIDFLDEFISKLLLDTINIGGNSFGGYLSWVFTLQRPSKVKKLILVNASGYPRGVGEDVPLAFRLARNSLTAPLVKKITPKSLVKKTVLQSYGNDDLATEAIIERYYELLLRKGNRRGAIQRMQQIELEHWQQISKIQAPTLILWGDQDEFAPLQFSKRFHKDLPNSKLIVYPDVGHITMEEVPEESAAAVQNFLIED